MPVDAAMLFARADAYRNTRATITTSRLCLRMSPTSERVPPEIVDRIIYFIEQSNFGPRLAAWDEIVACCKTKGNCTRRPHTENVIRLVLGSSPELASKDTQRKLIICSLLKRAMYKHFRNRSFRPKEETLVSNCITPTDYRVAY